MRGSASMLRLAKANAWSRGARVEKGRAGYCLTMDEMLDVYKACGFNHRGTAMRRHVAAWMACDEAVADGDLGDGRTPVWFACPPGQETEVRMLSESCRGRCVVEIRREDWPVLQRMHGLQRFFEEGEA